MFKQLLAYRNLLFILFLLNSACFFLTDDKKAGIPYLRELYLLGIVGCAAALFLVWKRVYQSKASLWIIFMGLALPILSAIMANLNFGQPFLYGLLEERRSFAYLVFFPALFLLIKTAPSQQRLETFFLYSGLACAFVGYCYYFGIIPENSNVSFTVDAKDAGEVLLRPNRFRIGSSYVTISAFMLMYSMKDRISLAKVATLLFFASYLWLVLQTRQTMIIWCLAGLWIFRDRIDSLLKLGLLASTILVASYFLFPEFYYEQYVKFEALLDEATTGPGVRDTTTAIILGAVADNWYIGLGSLSLQWNGGFSTLYNPHFYLSDVGIVGVYYRYGFLTPVIAFVFYAGFLRIMKNCPNKGNLLNAFQLVFWFQMLNMFLSNSLMYGGDVLGIAAASFLYYSKAHATEKSTTPVFRGARHDNLQYRDHQLE
ncbi:hypothetical protein [Phytopseudomonas dryadis]|uniref:Uncharacterized protein n=1 Tax=Phytopseudomonas dryadis TaxID=2487520 RepID=A0A4Q9QVT6_9GAMM|nr:MULTISPECIES: hypothetical protein [Pseudomonas]TBU88137.1 hypothetical protein DNK44_18910 [Pseudomonas dryadis]TBV05414.1 hypothetical protein DNK34_12805 [Pseudomonas dryadis]TBV18423.1 hypothetical protein DNK41_08595 [Pseudomonas sp. FRB 230]